MKKPIKECATCDSKRPRHTCLKCGKRYCRACHREVHKCRAR